MQSILTIYFINANLNQALMTQYSLSSSVPNPPGPISVESQTVDSINFTWPFPEGMDRNHYSFRVYTANGSFLLENNSFLLDNLQSGSPYSISVVTVGERNYESTAMMAQNYTSECD